MTERDRDDSGRFEATVSDAEILKAIRDHEPAGTSEVGNAVGLARQNVDYRLRQLEDEGCVESKKIGQSLVWTATDESEI